jgi:hypothetical protein
MIYVPNKPFEDWMYAHVHVCTKNHARSFRQENGVYVEMFVRDGYDWWVRNVKEKK